MNKKEQQEILHKLLERIESGEVSNTEALDYFRKNDPEMYALLKTASLFQPARQQIPSKEYKQASKNRIFNEIAHDLQAEKTPAFSIFSGKGERVFRPRLQTVLTTFLVIIISFGVLIGGAQAADAAAPGDFLYSVDLAIEDFQLSLTRDDMQQVVHLVDYSEERVDEASQQFKISHFEHGKMALVEYEHEISAVKDVMAKADPEKLPMMQELVERSAARNTEILTDLMDLLPPDMQIALAHAIDVSNNASDPNTPVTPLPADNGIDDNDLAATEAATQAASEAAATQAASEVAATQAASEAAATQAASDATATQTSAEQTQEPPPDTSDDDGKLPNPNKPTPRPTNPNRPTQKP